MTAEQEGAAPMEEPHIPDNREELYFQSDAELIKQKERLSKVNYDRGNAVKLPSKALCMQVRELRGVVRKKLYTSVTYAYENCQR